MNPRYAQIAIDKRLHRRLKIGAAVTGLSLKDFTERLLEQGLEGYPDAPDPVDPEDEPGECAEEN